MNGNEFFNAVLENRYHFHGNNVERAKLMLSFFEEIARADLDCHHIVINIPGHYGDERPYFLWGNDGTGSEPFLSECNERIDLDELLGMELTRESLYDFASKLAFFPGVDKDTLYCESL